MSKLTKLEDQGDHPDNSCDIFCFVLKIFIMSLLTIVSIMAIMMKEPIWGTCIVVSLILLAALMIEGIEALKILKNTIIQICNKILEFFKK